MQKIPDDLKSENYRHEVQHMALSPINYHKGHEHMSSVRNSPRSVYGGDIISLFISASLLPQPPWRESVLGKRVLDESLLGCCLSHQNFAK